MGAYFFMAIAITGAQAIESAENESNSWRRRPAGDFPKFYNWQILRRDPGATTHRAPSQIYCTAAKFRVSCDLDFPLFAFDVDRVIAHRLR
jgi:hypothetical protein